MRRKQKSNRFKRSKRHLAKSRHLVLDTSSGEEQTSDDDEVDVDDEDEAPPAAAVDNPVRGKRRPPISELTVQMSRLNPKSEGEEGACGGSTHPR